MRNHACMQTARSCKTSVRSLRRETRDPPGDYVSREDAREISDGTKTREQRILTAVGGHVEGRGNSGLVTFGGCNPWLCLLRSGESRMLDWPSGIQNTRRRKRIGLFRPCSPLSGAEESWEREQVKRKRSASPFTPVTIHLPF